MHAESPSGGGSTNIDLSHIPPEERERVWFEKYYQGDRVAQLTPRAVIMGGLIGMAMSVSNLYTTLKLGWSFGVAITACVISYAVWNAFVGVGLARTKMTILENNCMQSTASAAGYSTGGTLATAVGAMLMITGDAGRMGWVPVAIWVALVAFLGVFLAIPMKRQMINVEQLTFPSGVAAAETLKSLYAEGTEAVEKARMLIGTLIFGGVWGVLRSVWPVMAEVPLNFTVATVRRASGQTVPLTGAQLGMNLDTSALMVAAGMIVGFRVSLSMVVAGLINWLILVPYVGGLPDWSQEGKHFLGHLEVAMDGDAVAFVKVTRWSLWFGTAMLVTSGLTAFSMSWRTILRALTGVKAAGGSAAQASKMDEIEVPTSWMIMGMVPITLGLVALCWVAMGINPLLGLFSVVFSFFLSLVACRATGETDTTPVGALGKITQFVYAILAPADKTVNLMTAGITAGAAGSSADLLTDLKSGYLLGANPRQQFIAQFYGVFFGVLSVVPAWYLLVPNKAALEKFNSPATSMWYAVAEALSQGITTIPESARWAILVGGVLGILLTLAETLFPKARNYLPSTMGVGLAFVVSFPNSLSFFVGALIALVWSKLDAKSAEKYVVSIASGVVAGESLALAGYTVLDNLGVLALLGIGQGEEG